MSVFAHLNPTQSLLTYDCLCSNEVLIFEEFPALQNTMLGHSSTAVGSKSWRPEGFLDSAEIICQRRPLTPPSVAISLETMQKASLSPRARHGTGQRS